MIKTLLAGLFWSFCSFAQQPVVQQPDCVILFPSLTAVNQTAPAASAGGAFSNLNTACDTWNLSFSISGFSSVTVALQSAPNNAGSPGTWVTYNGQTLIQGSNPATITADGTFTWLTGYNPWVRVILSAATGSGTVSGAAFGWRIPSASTGSSGGGGTVSVSTPCTNSALVHQAAISTSSSGNVRIVTGVASTQIRICNIVVQTGSAEDLKLVQGTGATCASGPADLTGLFKSSLGFALDTAGSLVLSSAADLCLNQSVAQAIGGVVTYVQN